MNKISNKNWKKPQNMIHSKKKIVITTRKYIPTNNPLNIIVSHEIIFVYESKVDTEHMWRNNHVIKYFKKLPSRETTQRLQITFFCTIFFNLMDFMKKIKYEKKLNFP